MNSDIERLYQEIGWDALDVAGDDLAGNLLVYANVEDGAYSSDIFYADKAGNVRHRTSPLDLSGRIYELWERWREVPGNAEWRELCYLIDDGTLRIDLTYPEQIPPPPEDDEDDADYDYDRRGTTVGRYFPGMKIDYSRPRSP